MTKHICFDRVLPEDLYSPQPEVDGALWSTSGRLYAITPKGKKWLNGSTIKVGFLNGTSSQIDMVKAIAPEWTKYANLGFEFVPVELATIRVAFLVRDGAWSYIGTDNARIPAGQPTMNLGWQDESVILHEFGHMIGLGHEHQNPEGGIEWNEDAVIRDLSGPPNYWTPDQIRHNVLNKYKVSQINGTDFDPESIMLYSFPAEWTRNGIATHQNDVLSDLDKAFVASGMMYPHGAVVELPKVPVYDTIHGSISVRGEHDQYELPIMEEGCYTIETRGTIDTVVLLAGPGDRTKMIAYDDDKGAGRNGRIVAQLQPGTYYVEVKHHSRSRTGDYQLLVYR